MVKTLKIGNVTLENNLILAPMAGVTDLPFRLLCKRQRAGMVCMEMVSAKAILYKNRNTEELLRISPEEGPVSLQLFGSDPGIMGEIAEQIQNRPFDILDINMGCPVPKVVNNGEGSALMKDPALAEEIIRRVVRASAKPVTVKIRKGFDGMNENAVELAKRAERAGAAAVAVHGRTREQFYSGRADWEIIRKVKEAVAIPVIGNGDVDSPESAARLLAETGCDGVMVGRAARGNPWIFREIVSYLETGRAPERAHSGTCSSDACVQGGIHGGPRDEKACLLVYSRLSGIGKAEGKDQCDREHGGSGGVHPGNFPVKLLVSSAYIMLTS